MKKILVVGKDPKVYEDLRNYLDPQEYKLFPSPDSKNIVVSVTSLKPDLIIVDLNLPPSVGVEVLKNLKEANSNLPVIAITDRQDASPGLSDQTTGRRIKEFNFYGVVKRPILAERLSFMVEEALSSAHAGAAIKSFNLTDSLEKVKSDGSTALTINCEMSLGKASGGKKDYHQVFDQLLTPIFNEVMVNSKGSIYDQLISALERSLLSLTLRYCDHNQVKASQILGISRNTLRERIKRYDLW